MKQKQTHRHREQTCGCQGGGMDWEFGVSWFKLLCIGWINNKVLLFSTGNYTQYPVINHNGKEKKIPSVDKSHFDHLFITQFLNTHFEPIRGIQRLPPKSRCPVSLAKSKALMPPSSWWGGAVLGFPMAPETAPLPISTLLLSPLRYPAWPLEAFGIEIHHVCGVMAS